MERGVIFFLRIMPGARWLQAMLLLLLALPGGAGSHAAPMAEAAPQHILLLYAYGYGGRGVELFSDGFFKVITAAGFPVSNIHAEYLDLQRNGDLPGYRQELRDMLRKKYARQRIDLIVTLQQPALDFLLTDGRDIAAQAPVITIQHRPLLESEKAGRRVVGEINNFDIKGTLERALELFPGTRRVLFASGSSAADLKVAEEAAHVAEAWPGRLEFEYTTGRTLAEILQRVASLPPHSIIVFTQYNRDAKDRVALAYEAENMIVKAASAPVFGFYDYNLRNGGIGGSVIAVEASGASAGQMALDILRGAGPVADGKLVLKQNIPMFSWPQIERWGGDISRLPADTVFVERPPSLWQQHGGLIVSTLVLILTQSVLIALLLVNIRRRKRAEKVLGESELRYRSLVENSLDGVLLTTPDGAILAANPEAQRIFGRSEDELRRVGRAGVADLSDPRLQAALAERARTGRFRGELELMHKDGRRIPVELSSLVFDDENGRAMTSMIVRDIRARKTAEADQRRQAEELARRNEELERFNRATVGRELDMIALKQQVNALARELGREPVFPLAFLDTPEDAAP